MVMKPQASMEFLMIFAALLAILMVGIWVSFEKSREIDRARTDFEVEKILTQTSDKINTVFMEGHGFSTNLTLPLNILGRDYSIQIASNTIIVTFNGNSYSKYLLTRNITGSIKKGSNLIKNDGGMVRIL